MYVGLSIVSVYLLLLPYFTVNKDFLWWWLRASYPPNTFATLNGLGSVITRDHCPTWTETLRLNESKLNGLVHPYAIIISSSSRDVMKSRDPGDPSNQCLVDSNVDCQWPLTAPWPLHKRRKFCKHVMRVCGWIIKDKMYADIATWFRCVSS